MNSVQNVITTYILIQTKLFYSYKNININNNIQFLDFFSIFIDIHITHINLNRLLYKNRELVYFLCLLKVLLINIINAFYSICTKQGFIFIVNLSIYGNISYVIFNPQRCFSKKLISCWCFLDKLKLWLELYMMSCSFLLNKAFSRLNGWDDMVFFSILRILFDCFFSYIFLFTSRLKVLQKINYCFFSFLMLLLLWYTNIFFLKRSNDDKNIILRFKCNLFSLFEFKSLKFV